MKRILSLLLCACLLLALLPVVMPPARMISQVSLSADHTAAEVGDMFGWNAYGMDGSGNYAYHFEIDCDNWPVYIDDWENWRSLPFLTWDATKPGSYKAKVMVRDLGMDDYAEAVSAETVVCLRPAPVIAVEIISSGRLMISWDHVPGCFGYEMLRSFSQAGPYTSIGYTDDIRHTDVSLAEGTLYWYKVRTYNGVNGVKYTSGELSGAASGVPIGAPPIPQAIAEFSDSLSVTWQTVPFADGYLLWRSASTDDAGTQVYSGPAASYTDTGLLAGTTWYYRVRAYKTIGGTTYQGPFSLWGLGVPMKKPLAAPAAITSIAWRTQADAGDNLRLIIDLAWTPVNKAIGYEVLASVANSSDYDPWEQTLDTSASAGFNLPAQATRYWFKVRAYDEYTDPKTKETLRYFGPYSPESYIDVPALTGQQTLTPLFTGIVPDIITAQPSGPVLHKVPEKLVTAVPMPTFRRVTHIIPPPTPEPTLQLVTRYPAAPAPIVEFVVPRLVTPTPTPFVRQLLPLEPVIPLAPIRRINP